MIEKYYFGSITISGKTYNYDIEVRGADEVLRWQRLESHIIDIESVKRAVSQNPETIIIGTGKSGMAKVTEEAQKFIKDQEIELIIDITEEAVKTFNILVAEKKERQKKIIGLFHLTC